MRDLIGPIAFFGDKKIVSVGEVATRYGGNDLWRVVCNDGVYVVRRMGRGDGDADMEYSISFLAHQAGVAPAVLVYYHQESVMVSKWIEAEHKERLGADDLMVLIETLKRLHSIDISAIDIRTIDLRTIVKPEDGIDEAFGICDKYPAQVALCHNDLNPQNIIWGSDSVRLIDYEYAGLNDVYFDLVVVSVEFGLSEVGDRVLLDEYWGEDEYLFDKFHACKAIYGVLRRQWIEDHTP